MTCVFVCFKLNVALWYFIITFKFLRMKSVRDYSLLHFCVCMVGLFENRWDDAIPSLDILNTRNQKLLFLSPRPGRIHCASVCICAICDCLVDFALVQLTSNVIISSILCQIKSFSQSKCQNIFRETWISKTCPIIKAQWRNLQSTSNT